MHNIVKIPTANVMSNRQQYVRAEYSVRKYTEKYGAKCTRIR